jgi:hypothetical protein
MILVSLNEFKKLYKTGYSVEIKFQDPEEILHNFEMNEILLRINKS